MQKSEAESVGLDREKSTASTTDPRPDSLQAGRELDALIAEKVMGFPVEDFPEDAYSIMRVPGTNWCAAETQDGKFRPTDLLPQYSTDISDAWRVVEKMREDGWFMLSTILNGTTGYFATRLQPSAPHMSNVVKYVARGDSMPHAICLAALKGIEAAQKWNDQ